MHGISLSRSFRSTCYTVQPKNKTDIQTALDDKQIYSQLVIEDAKKEYKGKYYCVANDTAGEKASNPAFLSIEDLGEDLGEA